MAQSVEQLPSGAEITFLDFKAKDVLAARKVADANDENTIIYAIISQICLFDGKRMMMEDVAEMNGWDFLFIQNKINSAGGFTASQGK